MDSNTDQSASEKVDLTDFLKVREENFQRLMWNRAFLREKYEHDIKLLELERDAKLQENYALLQQLGMPEELMPLPPENEEIKKSRLADGAPRKWMDSSRLNNLGWKPRVDLATGLAMAYAEMLAR